MLTLRTHAPGAATEPSAEPSTTTPTFVELGIAPDLAKVLATAGINEPFPIQVATIPDVLAGRDLCGKAKTGSGKTLAFGLPMLMRTTTSKPRRPQSLVLVPTRELANQIADALAPLAKTRGLWLDAIFGGVSLFRQAQALKQGVDLVIATPGRMFDLMERGDIDLQDIRTVVLDEADQMADMGFLPQVERILDRTPEDRQTLLFSATLDGDVDRLVRKYQNDPVYHEIEADEEDASAMQHRFIGVDPAEKVAVAAAIASGPERTLLFVRTQRAAERLTTMLSREGINAGVLHGGISQPKRERALREFTVGRVPVLVATNIAARGIHVDGVDIVVHHDPPEDAKTYTHRSGRTARAGASGIVVTLVTPEDQSAVRLLKRDAGVREAVVSMRPDDPRLANLSGWTPPIEEIVVREPRQAYQPPQANRGSRAPRGQWNGHRRQPQFNRGR